VALRKPRVHKFSGVFHVERTAARQQRKGLVKFIPLVTRFATTKKTDFSDGTELDARNFYRASYASAVLGVVILSVRLSITRVLCD